jgi:hypothetical protein
MHDDINIFQNKQFTVIISYIQGEIVRLQHELKKTKNNVYQKASSVKSNVKGKSWEKPHSDAITDDQNKNGVQLLRVSSIS